MSCWGLKQNAFSLYIILPRNVKRGSLKILWQKVSNLKPNVPRLCYKTEKINFRELSTASWLFAIEGLLLNDQNSTNSTKFVVYEIKK
ncbi:hypothetical protein B0A64_17155 [Flavobacterium araucananum]|uniref:Uncharacterized protein n=1 Tax=Flavobacterium araucananum TaxID=946678 RepID=A0A227P188_9FLAO|nr:hypothetical protein B0A64_17155 [Flavobacterium araucananum]